MFLLQAPQVRDLDVFTTMPAAFPRAERSDWPHTTETPGTVDDAALADVLAAWCGDEAVRRRILVDNPAKLYGFAAA